MKIFVTGSQSFVGRELIRLCRREGIEVVGCDLVSSGDLVYEFHNVDIRSKELFDIIPSEADAVVHLAAVSRDSDCRENPLFCFDSNISGTVNVFEASRWKNAKQFIFASSEWVYGPFRAGEMKDEDTSIDPSELDSDYALSKLLGEFFLAQRCRLASLPTTILRFGIIYGPRPLGWSAVESLFFDVATKDEVKVHSLATGRFFVHVSDIARGIMKSFGLAGFHIINLVGDRLVTLEDIIDISSRLLARNPKITEIDPANVSQRILSNKRAKELLGWHPETDLEAGLKSLLTIIA